MITRIKIQNFGSLVDVDVPLGPLTLLVGPNASGKTMFIRALRTLTKLLRTALRGPKGAFNIDHATLGEIVSFGDPSREIRFSVWLDDSEGEPTYELALAQQDGLWSVVEERARCGGFAYDSRHGALEFATERRGTVRWETPGQPPRTGTLPFLAYAYRRDRHALSTIQPLLDFQQRLGLTRSFRIGTPSLISPRLPGWISPDRPYMDETGAGFIHTLARFTLTSSGREVLEERIIPSLRALFPHVESLGFRGGPSMLYLEYKTDRCQQAVPAHLESDGVNLALFFSSLPYLVGESLGEGERAPVCVGLEEPEAGTHPFFQRSRLELLRHLVRPSAAHVPLQIVATTHSIDLLRWVEQEEALGILRFVEHLGPGEGTRIHRLANEEDLARVYEEYDGNLGLAWYSGVFGAVPPRPELKEDS
ncbi:MAG TPA: AAA family ATPase [Thermoanaerobaculia bacterium]|nr:AAA family ATPase [Thermoanaerobaculia bacterium]